MRTLIHYIRTFFQRLIKSDEIQIIILPILIILFFVVLDKLVTTKKINIDTKEIPTVKTVFIKDEKYSESLEKIISDDAYIIDSLSRALQVKKTQIKYVDRIVTQIDTVIHEQVLYKSYTDSVSIERKDPYLSILAVGKKNETSYIKFNLTPDTLDITKVEHNPIFKPSYTDVYLHHSNPYFSTTNATHLRVEQRKVLFNVGLSGGYDFIHNQVYLGIGIQPSFLGLKIYKR